MGQRGITDIEVFHILRFPLYIRNSRDGTKEAFAIVNNRNIRIVLYVSNIPLVSKPVEKSTLEFRRCYIRNMLKNHRVHATDL